MLTISRKEGEELVIRDEQGKEIATVMVVELRGSQVRLGVKAPRQYPVNRAEVDEAKYGGTTK